MAQEVRSKGKKVDVPPEDRDRIVGLNGEGKGYTRISQETGYSRWTVALVLKDAGVGPAQRDGKAAAKTVTAPKPKQAVEAAPAKPAEVKKEPERRVTSKAETGRVPTAAELTVMISAAEQEAREYARQIAEYADELAKLWERAEYLAGFDETLAHALAAIRTLKRRVDTFDREVHEAQERSVQRQAAIHSEAKGLAKE